MQYQSLVNKVVKGKNNPRVKDSSFLAWKKEWHQVQGGPCTSHFYYRTRARSCIPPVFHSAVGKRQPPVESSAAGIN